MLTLGSCAQDKEKIVAEKIEERVSAFRAKKTEECREHLLQLAERIADSLLLADAQSALNDSLSRLRPLRPYEPVAIPPIDSLAVQPIFGLPLPASSTDR